jgi:hypothetical protein
LKELHMSTAKSHAQDNEGTILARFLTNGDAPLPKSLARYLVGLTISDRDKARMHDLAVRNQEGTLSPAEKEELHAFGKAGDVLAIFKSKARRTLGIVSKKRTTS